MNTYWFTVADGSAYQDHAERLRTSLERHGVSLTVLTSESSNNRDAKRKKISGILDAPRTCDRIVYLDADTLVLDPTGIENVSGAWRIPWRIPVEGCLPRALDPHDAAGRLKSFYHQHNLSAFADGGHLEGVEWNSGVIVGDRDMMIALAAEWALWWDWILDLFDGHFRRDQISFRIAYYNVCLARNIAGLPAEYNWIASFFGINPNAHILHRTMVRRAPWLEEQWERIAARHLAGEDVKTANQCFGTGGITDRPSLQRETHGDRAVEANLLRQTLIFSRPKRVLLCGVGEDDQRFLPLMREQGVDFICVAAPPTKEDIACFDLVLFCGVDFIISGGQVSELNSHTVFCFTGLHDISLYRHLYEFAYVRLLAHGFGLFSQSPVITTWTYEDLK